MKAVVFHGIGDIRLDDVKEPRVRNGTDAVVRLTASAICGTDLHMVRGTISDMKPGTILGHEGVGVVEEVGKEVRNFRAGDRVVVPSTISCGSCVYCRCGYTSQCDGANPNGPAAGTPFYGGPASSGPFDGMQAELVRVPRAAVNLVRLPDSVSDDQAILMSDIFPTGYMSAQLAEIEEGDVVVVFGCGPVGQFAIASAKLLGAGRVIAVDRHDSRLAMARRQGAETIDFDQEDPVDVVRDLTDGIGADRAIDAVGVDAEHPHSGPGRKDARRHEAEFRKEVETIAPKANPQGELWMPGDAPSQVLHWAVDALAKAGTLSIVGVYSDKSTTFPVGKAMGKNLTVKMGNCNHRTLIPKLLPLVQSGVLDPSTILTQSQPIADVLTAYRHFDLRDEGWIKVMVRPQVATMTGAG